KGPLERVVVVPEPYLVAEGMRLDKAVQLERLGRDLTRGCIVIDVGAGTTDICLVRDGAFPTAADQIRLEIAGNSIDHKIFTNALVHSPTLFLSRRMAREIKEEQAFVGGSSADATNVGSDLVALTEGIRKAGESLLGGGLRPPRPRRAGRGGADLELYHPHGGWISNPKPPRRSRAQPA